ncbi:MAG: hypothetical protein Q8K92_07265 [Leadbetterella sp.]|nr:hypothetical protein [Leadbetterella sp.]
MKKLTLFLLIISSYNLFGQNTSSIANEIEEITRLKDWETAKKRVLEFYKTLPENLNELQIVAKYEVSKLETKIDYFLEKENSLFNQLKINKNSNAGKIYLEEYPYSSKRREVSWLLATILNNWNSYYTFLTIYRSGEFISEAKIRLNEIDIQAFNTAKNIGTSDALNNYILSISEGKYIPEAKRLLAEKFEEDDFNLAKNKATVSSFTDFLSKYPNGKFSSKAIILLEEARFDLGEKEFKKQNWQTSIENFEEYLRQYSSTPRTQIAKKRIEAAKRKLLFKSNSMSYLSFDFDKENQLGLSFGTLNTQKANLYMKLKVNKEMLKRGGIFATTDNSGYTSSTNDVVFTGDTQFNNWSYILGFNFKIYEPAWIYLGGGVLNRGLYLEGKEYDSFGDYQKTTWMKNTDFQSYKFVGEAGVAINVLNKGIIKVGLSYYEKKINPQFGIGFGWR